MVRHAPNNNQRTAALFLSLGHHDTLIRRLHRAYRTRWEIMGAALQEHLPAVGAHSHLRRHQLLGQGSPITRQRDARQASGGTQAL